MVIDNGQASIIVEVKWHAPLSERQLEQQVEAAEGEHHTVAAVVLLGDADIGSEIHGKPCFRRTWRDVSGACMARLREGPREGASKAWTQLLQEFLHQTDMGRIFGGLEAPAKRVNATAYRFLPWFSHVPRPVEKLNYVYGQNNE